MDSTIASFPSTAARELIAPDFNSIELATSSQSSSQRWKVGLCAIACVLFSVVAIQIAQPLTEPISQPPYFEVKLHRSNSSNEAWKLGINYIEGCYRCIYGPSVRLIQKCLQYQLPSCQANFTAPCCDVSWADAAGRPTASVADGACVIKANGSRGKLQILKMLQHGEAIHLLFQAESNRRHNHLDDLQAESILGTIRSSLWSAFSSFLKLDVDTYAVLMICIFGPPFVVVLLKIAKPKLQRYPYARDWLRFIDGDQGEYLEEELYLMEAATLGARSPPSCCSLLFCTSCAISGYMFGDPLAGLMKDADVARPCIASLCVWVNIILILFVGVTFPHYHSAFIVSTIVCFCGGLVTLLMSCIMWKLKPDPTKIRGDGKQRTVKKQCLSACLVGPTCTISFWESGDLCTGQCRGDAMKALTCLFLTFWCSPPWGISFWYVACFWKPQAKHFRRVTHMHGGTTSEPSVCGIPVQVLGSGSDSGIRVNFGSNFMTLRDLQIKKDSAPGLKSKGNMGWQESEEECLKKLSTLSNVTVANWCQDDGLLRLGDVSHLIHGGPIRYEARLGVTSFQKSWTVLVDMHIDLSCRQHVGDYKGSFGQVWSRDECLALLQGRKDVTYAVWRKDKDGILHVFDISPRINAASLKYYTLGGAVSFQRTSFSIE